MIRGALLLAVCTLAVTTAAPGEAARAVVPGQAGPSEQELEARVEEIAAQLRCPTCRALSIEDSPSQMAAQMRDLVREQLRAGKSPEEVKAYFVDRYGEWILLKPEAKGFNWTVWLLPVLLLAGGLVLVLVTARRWVKRGRAREAELLGEHEGRS